jgi:hypothetical protein
MLQGSTEAREEGNINLRTNMYTKTIVLYVKYPVVIKNSYIVTCKSIARQWNNLVMQSVSRQWLGKHISLYRTMLCNMVMSSTIQAVFSVGSVQRGEFRS